MKRWTNNRLGKNNKHLWPIFANCIISDKKLGTKISYVGLARNFTAYCDRENVNPIDPGNDKSLNPLAVQYWMAERVYLLGSCNSIASWSGALTWVAKHWGMPVIPKPLHHLNNQFATFKHDLQSAYTRKSAEKVPCTVDLIVKYMKQVLDIVPGKLFATPHGGVLEHMVPYEKVLKALQMSLIFLGLYRPGEMSYSIESEEFQGVKKDRIFGLKWSHVKAFSNKRYRGGKYLQITVPNFKNQKDEWHEMVKELATPCCDKADCIAQCAFFNIPDMFKVITRWRRNRKTDPTPFNRNGSSKPMSPARVDALALGADNWVFMSAGGFKWRYEHFRLTTRHMTEFFKLPEEKKVTPHCFRVGATSLAYIQGIPCLIMCFYAEWSVKGLQISHAQYVKMLDELKLANVPFDLLHGYELNGQRFNCIQMTPTRWVLRKELILSELYGESRSTSCKERLKKKQKPLLDFKDPETNFVQFGSVKRDFH